MNWYVNDRTRRAALAALCVGMTATTVLFVNVLRWLA